MGLSLSYLFTASGSLSILDYQIDRFQVGTSGNSLLEVSSTYQLSSPLSNTSDYGTNSNLFLETTTQIANGVDVTGQVFALIPQSKITRINDNSVRYTLVLDEDAVNNLSNESINEIGLFMKNPTGHPTINKPILVAYRSFSDIAKTSDFSLIFRWTINFWYGF